MEGPMLSCQDLAAISSAIERAAPHRATPRGRVHAAVEYGLLLALPLLIALVVVKSVGVGLSTLFLSLSSSL
jgi:hypothetical protein